MITTQAYTSTIDVLQDRKILAYPLSLGASDRDKFDQEEEFMMFKISTDTKSSTLNDDKKGAAIVVADNTREGVGVGTGDASNDTINKADTRDLKIKFGDDLVNSTKFRTRKGKVRLETVIVLPMPAELQFNTSVSYGEIESTNLTKFGDMISNPVGGVLSDLVTKLKNQAIAAIGTKVGFLSTTMKSLAAEEGYAINPKKEVLYNSFGFRQFSFSFTFAPVSQKESEAVQNIIQTFRYYQLPELTEGKLFYILPAEFDIDFMLGQKNNPNIPRIATSVLQSVNVDYMPRGVWATLPNGAPATTRMTLNFLEMELIDRSRVYTRNNPIVSGY